MAKRRIKLTIDNKMYVAPTWELDDMVWHETMIGCPYCGVFAAIKPICDVIQFGLFNNDNVHTITQCDNCNKVWAMHYINTQEIEE